jgi:hypothetical protein
MHSASTSVLLIDRLPVGDELTAVFERSCYISRRVGFGADEADKVREDGPSESTRPTDTSLYRFDCGKTIT